MGCKGLDWANCKVCGPKGSHKGRFANEEGFLLSVCELEAEEAERRIFGSSTGSKTGERSPTRKFSK
jgi:hypothetical protein